MKKPETKKSAYIDYSPFLYYIYTYLAIHPCLSISLTLFLYLDICLSLSIYLSLSLIPPRSVIVLVWTSRQATMRGAFDWCVNFRKASSHDKSAER